ncbi:MAG: Mur ligase family protein [Acidimicrobiia bacterium]
MTETALVELRVLEGPNLFFPRPAVKLTLDVSKMLQADEQTARQAAERLGLPATPPGAAGSEHRRRFIARLVARLTRLLARAGGVGRLAVRSRPGDQPHLLVTAFPWRRLEAARALGEAVGRLSGLLGEDLPLEEVGRQLRAVDPGPPSSLPDPLMPVIGVTGTNGKTTITRLLAHIGRTAGLRMGWANTDGIFVEGELVEEGDWSGFGGTQQVVGKEVDLAVLEIARGGILLRGIGTAQLDVAVVTNVSADHLGQYGVETLDQLAEVKAVLVRIVRPQGWAVLNADDPRVLAMRRLSPGRPWVFSRHAASPGIRASLGEGGRAATVMDGRLAMLDRRGNVDALLPVLETPLTLAGLSSIHTENALAAAAAALGAGIPREAVVEGLRTFRHDPQQNPGRLNLWQLGDRTVIVDYAHNQESLRGLLEVADGLRPPGALTWVIIGTAGDRSDQLLRALGEAAALGADRVAICEKERYLRGRDREEMSALMQAGARKRGKEAPAYPTELDSLREVVGQSGPRDVVAISCHVELTDLNAWLEEQGAALLTDEQVRERTTR